ncbi:hypothetical protein [Nocardioides xinjiangensis]|uniref:hypothetical protein n=1 Tax=Nocardioides xinjiangensis TaxID=2817376 RepID=UPI001B30A453|nr:hypothetical protein [Nocardioides sp. SYSU D00778]
MLRNSSRPFTALLAVAALLGLILQLSAPSVVATPEGPSGPASESARTAPFGGKVIAARTLGPEGGVVKASNGVSIRVPTGVMRFRGRVEIAHLGDKLYDFHIYARWRGRVAIRLPKVMGRPLIMHNVDGRWKAERAKSDGRRFAVAHVRQLSTFTNLVGCLKALKKPSPGVAVTVAKCLIGLGIRKVPEWIGKQIVGLFNEYDACEPFTPSNWSIDLFELLGACTLHAPECEYSGTCGVNDPPTATPTPTPTVPPSPPSSPNPPPPPTSGNPPFTGGYFIADAVLGGTWPRTDPWNGTWYSRSNRPPNAADYWWANGLGVGFSCGTYAAPYGVRFSNGTTQTWNTWLRSTDTWGGRVIGLWVPSAVARDINVNGLPPGMPRC